ncbi:MAG: helix-hairpin-helix domain-containing protein [Armatimonadetes bacterium]|nr:helix-hairpin-helix domain-containing protein [Armatimonadota bacterium]
MTLPSRARAGILAATVAGALGWVGWTQVSKPAPLPVTVVSASSGAVSPPSEAELPLVVDVEGAVRKPGLYRFAVGATVEDALTKAGGPAEGAQLDRLNRAAALKSGTQLFVPRVTDPDTSVARPYKGRTVGKPPRTPRSKATSSSKRAKKPAVPLPELGSVSLNEATAADFNQLPGVSPKVAEAIVNYRLDHGGFSSLDELGYVSGISPALLEQIRPYLRL